MFSLLLCNLFHSKTHLLQKLGCSIIMNDRLENNIILISSHTTEIKNKKQENDDYWNGNRTTTLAC